jgi:nitrite reductase [NAD(P)H] small subunit
MRKPFTAIRAEMHTWATPISAANETRTGEPRAAKWTAICPLDDIPLLGARVVRRGVAPNIAVFRSASDQLFALADRCPHRGGPLSQGIVYGERVACPLHNTSVDLGTGCAVAPDKGEVQRFAVKVVAGIVYVDLEPHANGNG